ncbi:MAG TPA: hypothetical protein VGC50_15360 [Gammaproteobacteria bacterium]|jgi:hypothetical protein
MRFERASTITVSFLDPHRLLSGLHKGGVSLDLSTLDVCFLGALYLRADQDGLAAFEEELVFDVFDRGLIATRTCRRQGLDLVAAGRLFNAIGRLIRTLVVLAATALQYIVIRHRPSRSLAAENLLLAQAIGVVSRARDQAEEGG